MCSIDTDSRGLRRRRWNLPKSVATPCADSGAHADAISNSNTDTDAHTHTNTDTNAHAERRDDDHHHLHGRLTKDAHRAAGDTRDIREQRHAGARDGFESASGAHRLS